MCSSLLDGDVHVISKTYISEYETYGEKSS